MMTIFFQNIMRTDWDWICGGMIGAIIGWCHAGDSTMMVILASVTRAAVLEIIGSALLGAISSAIMKELIGRLFKWISNKVKGKRSKKVKA